MKCVTYPKPTKQYPKENSTRIVEKFLWFPLTIEHFNYYETPKCWYETRWLAKVKIKEKYYWKHPDTCDMFETMAHEYGYGWWPIEFID